MIFAIDPGNKRSGFVVFDGYGVTTSGNVENDDLLVMLSAWGLTVPSATLAIEMMRARGMPMSNDEMETLVWVGRFRQAWPIPRDVRLIYRADVKLHVCGNARAKDPNIRQALIDLLGKPGTKKAPGRTYGVASHAWAALAVAVTCEAQRRNA